MSAKNSQDAERLTAAAAHWRSLAADEIKALKLGVRRCKRTTDARVETYERTARAIEIERDTGIAVCSCCHAPLSDHPHG